jgi:uncharacterized protein
MAETLTLRVARSMREIDAASWDACANPAPYAAQESDKVELKSQEERYNPFISHAFLDACERSGSAVARTGWAAAHVLVEDASGRLLAAAPSYLKSHSMGEYVFDWSWAEAFERVGGQYYPKVQVCCPFTPAQGRRLLAAPGPRAEAARSALIEGLRALRERARASSIHVTFPTKEDGDRLAAAGFLRRSGKQFHFFNKGYADFDDFLARLASRKRKMIRREREQAVAAEIAIERLTGADLREEHWDAFFAFYMDTGAKKWGRPYLTRDFFSRVSETLADRILLVMAKRAGKWIAGALNFIGDDALYGRNWGCVEDHPFLHFEVCYYQAIAFALERGLARVEAGAQGEHKLARGYEPVETLSAHEIADRRLARAVADFLQEEQAQNEAAIEAYGERAPFRKT